VTSRPPEPGTPAWTLAQHEGFSTSWSSSEDLDRGALAITRTVARTAGASGVGLVVHRASGGHEHLGSLPRMRELDALTTAGVPSPTGVPLQPGEVLAVRRTATDERWPSWSRLARSLGWPSAEVVGLPDLRGRPVSMQLLWHTQRLGDGSSALAPLAHWAGLELRRLDRMVNLERALLTRTVIGRAQGILMERHGLTAPQAMAYLRRSSQAEQVRLADIAAGIAEAHPDSVDDARPGR
jgi:hypothetical protein